MGYLHIDNLYKNQDILMFKECYAMEKIHGTSAHISFNSKTSFLQHAEITFFSGGEKHVNFVKLFDVVTLKAKIIELGFNDITIYGEAYGGKCQGMSGTYGKELKFIAFDVKVGEHCWLDVPKAEEICKQLEIEFVQYEKVPTDIELLNKLSCAPSMQALKNLGLVNKLREGIVLRPLIELRKNNGSRIIVKHKNKEFQERISQPRVKKLSEEELKIMTNAKQIADEWVTPMRLKHVLDKLPKDISIENTAEVMKAMVEDVSREAKGEIVENKKVRGFISKKAASLFHEYLKNKLSESQK